jgi:hypothetical protein
MPHQITFAMIAVLGTALFAATLAIGLTVQSAYPSDGNPVCSTSNGACADNVRGEHVTTGPTTNPRAIAQNLGIFG